MQWTRVTVITVDLGLCFAAAINPNHRQWQVFPDGSLLSTKEHLHASLLRSETNATQTGVDSLGIREFDGHYRANHGPVDGTKLSNELANVTHSIDQLQGNVSSVDVMRVKMDGNGDTLELLSTVVFTLTVSVWMLVAFKILSSYYPASWNTWVSAKPKPPHGVKLCGT